MSETIKILFAEDEPILAKIVGEGLESHGFKVQHASDGQLAMSAFKKNRPDICVFDIMMPELDGLSLARMVRELDQNIPILFLTAKNTSADVVEGFDSGGNDYLRKPFSMQELVARIENLLRLTKNKSVNESPIINSSVQIGQFEYNSSNQNLSSHNSNETLSYREHELLMKLILSNKEIVIRKEILIDIWGDDSLFHSRNLDVYIRKLRTRFEDDDKIQIITLKGVGYRFVF
ncbi:UNVERIFIED_CONTAM: hypothetical protein GTU68_034576 [Idotea baltica]|nr:hypothetical protein [Idotea baltica]